MTLEARNLEATSSHHNGLLPSLAHTLLLADVRRCRSGVWTTEMFVEWRKLGSAMWGLAGLVMLENDQEASEHGVFCGRGPFGELCGQPGSQTTSHGKGTLRTLCHGALVSCFWAVLEIAYAIPPPSEPHLGHSVFLLPGSASWPPGSQRLLDSVKPNGCLKPFPPTAPGLSHLSSN